MNYYFNKFLISIQSLCGVVTRDGMNNINTSDKLTKLILLVLAVTAMLLICIAVIWTYHMARRDTNKLERVVQMLYQTVSENNVVDTMVLINACPMAMNIPCTPTLYTPFLKACLNGNAQLVKFMIARGANVHQTTDRGETGLYLAVSHHIRHPDTKDASCIHALYHAGVDINAVTYNGYTALQLAAVFGHTPLVCWLLSKNARNIGYPDAYMLARSQGYHETALRLRSSRIAAIE